jgi:NADH-quinone oxidoreductase subunit M
MADLLLISILTPVVVALLLMMVPSRAPQSLALGLGLAGFVVPCVLSIRVFIAYFAQGEGGFIFLNDIDTGLSSLGISLKLGVNGISAPLFLLAGTVGLAAGITAVFSVAERKKSYLILLLIMQSGLMGIFCTVDLFYIYFFHEVALIPTFIMIAIWGGHHRRAAAMEMTIYLTLGAMLSLVGLIGIYAGSGLNSFDLLTLVTYVQTTGIEGVLQNTLFGLLMFGLGILVSLFPLHSWAPRGYTAAPTSVSMLHAGVLKKFGLYVLIQVGLPILGQGAIDWSMVLAVLALGNIVIIGLVTMAQTDFKQLIAYASVMHMGYIFLGIATLTTTGVGGAVFLMLAHGFSAALLFNLAVLVQNRARSFYLDEMGGLGKFAPVLAGFLMVAMMVSIGLPGFANFWGELTIFVSLWQWNPVVLVIALTGIVISAVYGLRAVAAIVFGEPTDALQKVADEHPISDVTMVERLPSVLLLLALLVFGLMPSLAGNMISDSLAQYGALPEKNSLIEPVENAGEVEDPSADHPAEAHENP